MLPYRLTLVVVVFDRIVLNCRIRGRGRIAFVIVYRRALSGRLHSDGGLGVSLSVRG